MPLPDEDQPITRDPDARRAAKTLDEVLDALAEYPDRDDAVKRLENDLVDERVNRLGSIRAGDER